MAITKDASRQPPITARVVASVGSSGDISAQATYAAIDVPVNAIVVGGYFNITDATSANVDFNVGDGGSATRYVSAADGATTGVTALTLTGYKYTAADTIDINVSTATPSATGEVELVVTYIVDGRAEFAQG